MQIKYTDIRLIPRGIFPNIGLSYCVCAVPKALLYYGGFFVLRFDHNQPFSVVLLSLRSPGLFPARQPPKIRLNDGFWGIGWRSRKSTEQRTEQ